MFEPIIYSIPLHTSGRKIKYNLLKTGESSMISLTKIRIKITPDDVGGDSTSSAAWWSLPIPDGMLTARIVQYETLTQLTSEHNWAIKKNTHI